jgi:uncharacterized protein Yka (UPF0111/DUF47 family)
MKEKIIKFESDFDDVKKLAPSPLKNSKKNIEVMKPNDIIDFEKRIEKLEKKVDLIENLLNRLSKNVKNLNIRSLINPLTKK